MQRREAISKTVIILGSTMISSSGLITACQPKAKTANLEDIQSIDSALLDEIADIIIPDTADSPGAKKAKSGDFMKLILRDCYEEEDQKIILNGIIKLVRVCKETYQKNFSDLHQKEKHHFLVKIDKEAKSYENSKVENSPSHYFTMIKKLTIFAYFSSEEGTTQALRYNPIPKRYDGCVPYKKGEKAWV